MGRGRERERERERYQREKRKRGAKERQRGEVAERILGFDRVMRMREGEGEGKGAQRGKGRLGRQKESFSREEAIISPSKLMAMVKINKSYETLSFIT